MNTQTETPVPFLCFRQRPTDEPNEVEEVGAVKLSEFLELLRSIDWRHEANQAEWAMKASPTLGVTNQCNGCSLWVSAIVAGAVIDVDAEPDERFRTDRHEPWYSVGMSNPPALSNIEALDPHGIGDNLGFTAFTTESVEECFEWFFNDDYRSLYELFRWV